MTVRFVILVLMLAGALSRADTVVAAELPALTEITITSSLDGTPQKSQYWVPESASTQSRPLLVMLHSWSADYRQKADAWMKEAVQRDWIYIHPNFRGPNNRPQACGSELARQDVLDAIDDAIRRFKVDESRVYLAGTSGGGHMTMLMAAYYPQRFSAASAWVGISNLADWYRFHVKDGKPGGYARMTANSCGGAPGSSAAVDAEYKARSPLFHLHHVGDLPLDLNAGVNDGHTGSVPVRHTLQAFNVVAKAGRHSLVSEREMTELWEQRKLAAPLKSDQVVDKSYGRQLHLRRHAGPARVTIFEGGHEGIAHAGCEWLAAQKRKTRAAGVKRRGE
ncbi:MAG: prolyl oligopeptidase family serine peptidase [Planctomycetaceae bacterium]|nr:prolyl oligopeptidase family serine peptidase [Planctomycetaceae bacterium]MBT6156190.1 prolyl oligopeptidase family serine peptidase [Planctomycetaceae bacterium]MBT6487151.1 prolyl oligopeptidase family serine peptidase [Planctomycetaceae bacterium]MBT6496119.1 prolyl oligopeptidase family serine peptidase [Planctomycetaceae bacterium]